MIEINNLTKCFGSVKAVDDLSLTIKPGVTGLIGENGAGKSTLLRLIADVYQPNNGRIIIGNELNTTVVAKRKVFFLSDNPYAPSNNTIMESFKLYSSLFDLDASRFERIMKTLSLPLDRKIATFSKGMKRQFFLAIALSSKANYILLDEAFDGLDPLVLDQIRQEIVADADNKIYIVSSHNISNLERLCDSFILLSKGKCSKNADLEHVGINFVKYQILANAPLSKEILESFGLNVLSFKKIGSIANVVFNGDVDIEKLKKCIDLTLCEKVSIDTDELIALEMLSARKGDK